jgi:hypothetical protein
MLAPSPLVLFGIPLLALVASSTFLAITRSRDLKLVLLVTAWFMVTGIFAVSGLGMKWDMKPPPMVLAFVLFFAASVLLTRSKHGRALVESTPVYVLVGAQVFRFPLELLMHQAGLEGVMPMQMSYAGYNFDIVTGITALPIAYAIAKGKAPSWLALAWNTLGSATLLIVVVIAIVSTPPVHAFGDSPEKLNIWIAQFPFVWLPAVMVQFAFISHVTLWRKLRQKAFA